MTGRRTLKTVGCTPTVSRRHLLQAGGLGLTGVTLPQLLRAASSGGGPKPRADACILLFLNGGPSHLDMWDLKPDQPAEINLVLAADNVSERDDVPGSTSSAV